MFDIGFWEVAFLGLLALLILGPKRLPEAARSAGQWVGKLRNFITNVKQDLNSQLQSDELAELRRLKDELLQARETLQQTSESMVSSITDAYDDGMGEGTPDIAPELDFIDEAVSSPTPDGNTRPSPKLKARRKNGKPAVVKKKKAASKKTGKKTGNKSGAKKKVSKSKPAKKKTKNKVKSKKNDR